MKKKWIWLLLPAALLLLILLHVHSLARLAPSEIGRQVPVLMYHAVGDDCWGEEHLFVRPAKLEQQQQSENGCESFHIVYCFCIDDYFSIYSPPATVVSW